MQKKNLSSAVWHHAVASITIGFSTLGMSFLPATAAPIKESGEIAQVRVRSRISPPTPLNLRPRTHIPLPARDSFRHSSDRFYRHHRSDYPYRKHKPDYYKRSRHRNSRYNRRNRHGDRNFMIIISPKSQY